MTDQQLSGEHLTDGFARLVQDTEPPLHIDPLAGVRRGRKLAKRRRLLVGAALVSVIAVFVGTAAAADVFTRAPRGKSTFAAGSGRITGPMNILVVGVDRRDGQPPAPPGGAATPGRADTILVVHLDRDLRHAYTVSFPRDTYLSIPAAPPAWAGGQGKINAATMIGGVSHLVKTVQAFAGLTIDHAAMIDLAGVAKLTDAVGGVDVLVSAETRDPYRPHHVFKKGLNHLDGKTAERYLRQRQGLPHGELDRVRRHQQFLHALLTKLTRAGALTKPGRLSELMNVFNTAITVDRKMPVHDLALALRHFGPDDVSYLTLPLVGPKLIDGAWCQVADETAARRLFTAMNVDAMGAYVKTTPPNNVTGGR